MPAVKPPRLRPGDHVGVVSPSWGGAGRFPHRVERGVAQLLALEFRVKLAPHALGSRGHVSGSAEERAADIHAMFLDPEVRLVLAAIGGDHSCQLLPHLDFDLIRRSPKLLVGFSDVTVLNVAIWKETGLVTLNGPALLTDFAESPAMLEYTRERFLRVACDPAPAGAIEPAASWTQELLDWEKQEDLARPRRLTTSPGWSWLRGGSAEGVLVGGCIESLQHLRGTRFWADLDGAILFLETSELKPSPATVDGLLSDYENMGVLARISGLLFGRPMRYTDDEKRRLREVILERTARHGFPVVADMDFGHTAPQMTLPIGCRARIDAEARRFEIVEGAVM